MPEPSTIIPAESCRVAVIFLQPHCNMHCTFCITEDGFDVMTFAQGLDLLVGLRAAGVSTVVIGGGEPFDWPHDPLRLAAEARRLGFLVQIGTNGIALPEGFERLACVDRWVLPLESIDPEPHNRMRLYRDRHHQIILSRLAALREARKSVTISTVITQANHEAVFEIAEFLREEQRRGGHIHAWHLYQFIPAGRGGAVHGPALRLEPEGYDRIVDRVQSMNLPFRVYRRSDMYRSRTVDFFWYEGGRICRGSRDQAEPAESGACGAVACGSRGADGICFSE